MNTAFRRLSIVLLIFLALVLMTVTASAQSIAVTASAAEQAPRGELPGDGVPQDVIYVSFNVAGVIGGIRYDDEDILAFDRSVGVWYKFFDGSDVGITRNIDAFALHPGGYALLSLSTLNNTIPGIATPVDQSDLIRFTPTSWGETTAGTFSLEFDGSDVGFQQGNVQEDIDALWIDSLGRFYISTNGTVQVTGGLEALDEDLLRFTPTSLGANTAGTWEFYFDGSRVGLSQTDTEDINAFFYDPGRNRVYLSTEGNFNNGSYSGQGSDVISCELVATGNNTTVCNYDPPRYLDLSGNRTVDALSIGVAEHRSDLLFVSTTASFQVGGVAGQNEDIRGYDRDKGVWFIAFDGTDVNLGARDVDGFSLLSDGSILLTIREDNITLPGISSPIDDSDLVRFIPTALGVITAGTFSMYFDGSDVGLDLPGEDVVGFDNQSDGSLLISARNRITVPGGGSNWNKEDIVLFSPTAFVPETAGSWSLFFDGSDVGLATTASEWTTDIFLHPVTGRLHLMTAGNFSVPGVSGTNQDIFICNLTSIGDNTGCNFDSTLFFDGSAVGLPANKALDAFALAMPSAQPAPDFSNRTATDEDFPASAYDDHLPVPEAEDAELMRVPTAVTLQRLETATLSTPVLVLLAGLLLALSLRTVRRARRR